MEATVISEVTYDSKRSEFHIETQEGEESKEYSIVNKGENATKDYLFVRPGQVIQVEGEIIQNTIYNAKNIISLKHEVIR